jgi:signal transduction histidine kinase
MAHSEYPTRSDRLQTAPVPRLVAVTALPVHGAAGASRPAEPDRKRDVRLMAYLTHEMRNPLTAIVGFAELLHDGQAGALCPAQAAFIDHILTGAHHLLHLVNDTLDLAKFEAGALEFVPADCDVAQVMADVEDLTRLQAADKQQTLRVVVDPDLGAVTTDAHRLRQVLLNYVSNAIKFTPGRGTITMRARREGAGRLRVEVEDDGPGIPASEIGRLFVEFQQLDSAKRREGTGLGLALCKRIVEAQGGQVGVRSRVGRGSVFYAVLPSGEPHARSA